MIRAGLVALFLLFQNCPAEEIRVAVDGVGCHTRQLAVQKIWSSMPGVSSVIILPRGPSDPANQRIFVITAGKAPDQAALETALGARTRFYKVLSVSTKDSALSKPSPPSRLRP
jgi:hypothetical protein